MKHFCYANWCKDSIILLTSVFSLGLASVELEKKLKSLKIICFGFFKLVSHVYEEVQKERSYLFFSLYGGNG